MTFSRLDMVFISRKAKKQQKADENYSVTGLLIYNEWKRTATKENTRREEKKQMEVFGRFLSDIRIPTGGKCPLDRKQTNESPSPNNIEETYELKTQQFLERQKYL